MVADAYQVVDMILLPLVTLRLLSFIALILSVLMVVTLILQRQSDACASLLP